MSEPTRGAGAAARPGHRAAGENHRAGAGKIRRQAWLLAALAVLFYAAYMTWMALRANGAV
jgi:hypothetical protein